MHSYKNILDGAKGLLVETISAIEPAGLDYIIVGGWSPYLRNETTYTHPGTKDVDILFNDGDVRGKIGGAIKCLLDNDFLISAKHDFQLFKKLNVQGKDVIYHVDLLHPQESSRSPELMVDHFDLGLSQDYEFADDKRGMSIALPSSKFLFDGFYSPKKIRHEMSNGEIKDISVPLIDEAGLIFSKCMSAQVAKRPRDSYDIFLAFKQPSVTRTINKLRESSAKYDQVRKSVKSLYEFIENQDSHFEYNVCKYIKDKDKSNIRGYCIEKLEEILS